MEHFRQGRRLTECLPQMILGGGQCAQQTVSHRPPRWLPALLYRIELRGTAWQIEDPEALAVPLEEFFQLLAPMPGGIVDDEENLAKSPQKKFQKTDKAALGLAFAE